MKTKWPNHITCSPLQELQSFSCVWLEAIPFGWTLLIFLCLCVRLKDFFLLTSFYITLSGPVTQLNDPFNKHDKILIRAYYRI